MNSNFGRRSVMAGVLGGVLGLARRGVKAQQQTVDGGLQIVATGNVRADQAVGGQQSVYGAVSSTGQLVRANGQIVATGDVDVSQAASGQQAVYSTQTEGCAAAGLVFTDFNGGLYTFDVYCQQCPVEISCNCGSQCGKHGCS